MSEPSSREAGRREPVSPLVSPAELLAHLGDERWVVVDCRFDLAAPGAGEQAYETAHIPGAVYAHLDRDLSAPVTGRNGRHPLPDAAAIEATCGRLGIGPDAHVVAYDQDTGMFASRLWWMLRYVGHDRAAVLDGGFAAWVRAGGPTCAGREQRPACVFRAAPRPEMIVSAGEVLRLLGRRDWRLVDARAPERYAGEVEPIDPVAGHIPGARNHPYQTNVDEHGRFLPAPALRARFEQTLGNIPPERTIVYCGSGVSACHDLLAMEIAGMRGARLYAGSWSEWCADPSRPIERGADRNVP
jgi:thiosulfate/3-mercaptopyruvate sulfurtransferase